MSAFDLTGKVAVVTGSSRGIGRAIAEGLAAQGARVVISSRKQDACEEVAAAINAEHGDGTAVAIAASISEKAQLEDLFAQAKSRLGAVDILVCNAATNPYFGSMDGIADEQFRKTLDNNVLSNHWLVQLALPDMRKRGDGAIVIISSIGGLRASTTLGAYCISKAADFQLVRNYAAENGKHGIRVNGIAPGLVKTEFARALWDNPEALAATEKALPMRRIGDPDDITGAAVYLASPAARWTTGQTIVVDGGATI
ncbi:SDR family oxidoreductase [Qipengyuania sp. 6B39]|uniref:SDR family NAD(P)-dependent oxidoreductase n=1 Tax=Qipengyuania proteolytica TaxID=2867239 RepID=UPI001C893268|nr:SDR family oxidoreductase [Qipengyuania proteolytica]MBX7495171.1 SDR family oxidoreductase [Qipengyuania proteolytica]